MRLLQTKSLVCAWNSESSKNQIHATILSSEPELQSHCLLTCELNLTNGCSGCQHLATGLTLLLENLLWQS